jgi:hypothetical protein
MVKSPMSSKNATADCRDLAKLFCDPSGQANGQANTRTTGEMALRVRDSSIITIAVTALAVSLIWSPSHPAFAQSDTAPAHPHNQSSNGQVSRSNKPPASEKNQSQTKSLVIETDAGPVRVKDFLTGTKEADEFGGSILEKTSRYVISYNKGMLCFEDSKRSGCFGIDLTTTAVKSDQIDAEKRLMLILSVAQGDFCKLPIAVTTNADAVTGSKVATPPSICPNRQLHFQ